MNDSLHEKLSQFVDDELGSAESLALSTAMQQQPELHEKLQRYRLMQQALKAKALPEVDPGFAVQLSEKLAQEPVYFLPQRRAKPDYVKNVAMAFAASVTAAAIIIPVILKLNATNAPTVAQAIPQQQVSEGVLLEAESRLYPVNQRFQGYLQAHNGSLYTNGAADLQNRAQLASYMPKE